MTAQLAHRTLFITTDVPRNGDSGGQIASWRMLQAHAAMGSVDLVATVPRGGKPSAELLRLVDRCQLVEIDAFYFATAKRSLLKTFLHAQVARVPYRVLKFTDPRIHECIATWIMEHTYRVVHCDFVSNWQYAERVAAPCRMLAHHNIEHQIYTTLASTRSAPASWLLRREALRAKRHELDVVRRADHTLVLSEADRTWLVTRGGECLAAKVSVWPIPVDARNVLSRPSAERLLILGSLRSVGRREGVRWLLREVWPQVRALRPGARLDIVGADPPADILAASGREGITVYGFVDDISQLLAQTQACLIPLFSGGGVRVKVLELLVQGVPCIGTSLAVQGLTGFAGVFVADSIPDWVNTVCLALSKDGGVRESALVGRRRLLAVHSAEQARTQLARAVGVLPGDKLAAAT